MRKDISVEIVEITPERAAHILERNTENRPISKPHLEFLTTEMRAGRWEFNGDSLRFNEGGTRLLDGQHRLHACIASGVTFEALMVSGLSENIFHTIDANKVRSAADMFAIQGEKNAKLLASSLKMLDRCLVGRVIGEKEKSMSRQSNLYIEKVLEAHPKMRESVVFCVKYSAAKMGPLATVTALHYLFSLSSEACADDFVDRYMTGVGLELESPIYQLRAKYLKTIMSGGVFPALYFRAFMIKAWNLWSNEKSVVRLTWDGSRDKFPLIKPASPAMQLR